MSALLRTYLYALGVAGLLAVVGGGCEDEVIPVSGTDQPFTLYGVVTPERDTQWVRVFPVESRLEVARPEPLDATVTSVERQSGEEHVWRDSLIQELNGQYAHVFWAPFRPDFGRDYAVDVRRSDGATTTVETRVPVEAEIEPQEPTTVGQVILPVLVKPAVPQLLHVEVKYTFDYISATPSVNLDSVITSYQGRQRRVEDGWSIRINLSEDFRIIEEAIIEHSRGYERAFGIQLADVTLRMIVASAEWDPPGGAFDPEVLVQPGTMSNVRNGFGFVGAGYRLSKRWVPPNEAMVEAGFRLPQGIPNATRP